MREFIKDVLSEEGRGSSKRVGFFLLVFIFIFILLVNLFSGKKPDETLSAQLYYMINALLIGIVGVNVVNAIKDIKTTQSDNNAKVNAPSPTPDPPKTEQTTIIK